MHDIGATASNILALRLFCWHAKLGGRMVCEQEGVVLRPWRPRVQQRSAGTHNDIGPGACSSALRLQRRLFELAERMV